MKFDQYYLECLSHASYMVGDETTGRAVVVDPQRDIRQYLADAEAAGLRIELIIETHFHADFLSGHLELSEATGAEIAYSAVADPEFAHRKIADGEKVSLGEVTLEFRHTPGHTPESMSIIVWEKPADTTPYAVLTGDTLFVGDVGRPDLLSSIGYSRDELAEMLYDSIKNKLMTLPDSTRVYPAHGAGSACGKNLSTELWSTIGAQRRTNYAVKAPNKAAFIEVVTEGQPPAPEYFVYNAILNRKNRELLQEEDAPALMTFDEAATAIASGAMLIDGRDSEDFARGHFVGAINVGLAGRYAEFAGSIIKPDVDLILMVDDGFELEAKTRLGRIGFDRVIGVMDQPLTAMLNNQERVQTGSRLTAVDFAERQLTITNLQVVDVRNPGEVAAGMIPGAVAIPVGQLPARIDELDAQRPTVVYCAGGYRSSVAASLLRQRGFGDVSDIRGGYNAWFETLQSA
jgi:glyoxylase-like metal-dependent hydrolase (beta-lactamase superfamily II)/rhodanese-related sulfurtransferase